MCNIAGYVGDRDAAPILLEMLRAQENFDGGGSTGIATIHEGKIHMRKVIGNVDTLIEETDALTLPGKIGIIHSKPTGRDLEFAHPFMADRERLCMVMNGTPRYGEQLYDKRLEVVEMLNSQGYNLTSKKKIDRKLYTILHTGETVTTADGGANYTEYLIRGGKNAGEAMSEMMGTFYADIVAVMLSLYDIEGIYVSRITRPMCAIIRENESLIATTAFGFPKEFQNDEIIVIPTMQCCRVTKNSLEKLPYYTEGASVATVNKETFQKGFKKIEELLKENWCCFDDVENLIYSDYEDIWDKNSTVNEHAPLSYEVLFALYKEGRLEMETIEKNGRKRIYMHIV